MIILFYIVAIFLLNYLPWWGLIFFSGTLGLYYNNIKHIITYNVFLGLVVWGVPFIYHYINNGQIIINRITEMLQLEYPVFLLLLTVLISSIISVLSGLSAFYLKKTINKF